MSVMAVWRIITLEQWTFVGLDGATVPSLMLLVLPVSGALVAGILYWGRARASATKLEPWRKWGAFLSIGSCCGLLLMQLVVIIRSFHVDLPLPLWAIGRTLPVMMMIMWLLAINQMPKLPYFEPKIAHRRGLGADLWATVHESQIQSWGSVHYRDDCRRPRSDTGSDTGHAMALAIVHFRRDRMSHSLGHHLAASSGSQMET
jgi:hypothetical protein